MYSIEQLQSLRIGSEKASYFQLYAEWSNLVATEQEQATLSRQAPQMYYNASVTLQVRMCIAGVDSGGSHCTDKFGQVSEPEWGVICTTWSGSDTHHWVMELCDMILKFQ